MGHVTRKGFEARVRELCAGQAILEEIADAMLSARASLDLPLLRTLRTITATNSLSAVA
jgi:hypothetical protein